MPPEFELPHAVIDPSAPNYANKTAFAAIKADGSIMAWGNSNNGGTSALSESGYTKIYSNLYAFAYPMPRLIHRL
jgi:hypothetical protein